MKKEELKSECKARNLNVSGNKADLVSFILTHPVYGSEKLIAHNVFLP